jgi:micrococcal nuclease
MLRSVRLFLGLAFFCGAAAPVAAAERGAETVVLYGLPELCRGTVASVDDGATLILSDGTGVRLAGIEPILAQPNGSTRWEESARSLLETLVLGRTVSLRGPPAPADRYGRVTGQLIRDDGLWIEGALLAAGASRVQPPAPGLAAALLWYETGARRRRLGLWRSPLYAVRTPDQLARDSGSFVVIDTRVAHAELRNGVVWLDLGSNAAARLDRPARHLFAAAGLDPLTLAGAHLRLRGWIRWQGRPVLDLAYPEAVELLARHRRPPP